MYLSHGLDNKRKISVPALILTLLFAALAGSLFINQAAANPVGYYRYPVNPPPSPIIEVIELDTDKLTLTFSVHAEPWISRAWGSSSYREWDYYVSSVEVFVDGKLWSRHGYGTKPIMVSLEGLSDGWHTLEVTATADGGGYSELQLGGGPRWISKSSSGVMEFSVNNPPPSVSVLSLENVASGEGVWFAFRVVGSTLSWVGYSLDGEENVTVSPDILVQSSLTSQDKVWKGNITLVGLSRGSHSLIVYAEETTGSVGAASPVTFTVETAGQPIGSESSLFPTTLVSAAGLIASAAAVSVGLVAYFLRRKKRGNSET